MIPTTQFFQFKEKQKFSQQANNEFSPTVEQ